MSARLAPYEGVARGSASFFRRLVKSLYLPAPETGQQLRRIRIMERDVLLPTKLVALGLMLYSIYFAPSPLIGTELGGISEATRYVVWVWVGANLVVAALLMAMHRVPAEVVQWAVFGIALVDGVFLSVLTLATGGYESTLYWIFPGLIVRGAVSIPKTAWQLSLNLCISAGYVLAGFMTISWARDLPEQELEVLGLSNLSWAPLFLGGALLVLMTFCCYGVQVLVEKQQQALEQARELGVREGQLRSAGRLAAEFAHQIKNPLAIINNAAFSLRRALNEGRPAAAEQIGIIQEEVERCDRIITQIMGYAQLTEGHVERLNLKEELDQAIERVFPPAAGFNVQVHREYNLAFPPLLMQRRHIADALLNVLQNAREAVEAKEGNVWIAANCLPDSTVEISIRDDGAGIPADRQERIFEAYYTTKEKGTGLGLATVKHNIELYGGTIRVESEPGAGARFLLRLPPRAALQVSV